MSGAPTACSKVVGADRDAVGVREGSEREQAAADLVGDVRKVALPR
jgi:hypothetical protein